MNLRSTWQPQSRSRSNKVTFFICLDGFPFTLHLSTRHKWSRNLVKRETQSEYFVHWTDLCYPLKNKTSMLPCPPETRAMKRRLRARYGRVGGGKCFPKRESNRPQIKRRLEQLVSRRLPGNRREDPPRSTKTDSRPLSRNIGRRNRPHKKRLARRGTPTWPFSPQRLAATPG